ncbi:MAG TPA: VTT domain-containing protein [Longimicrobiales bacterium]|nr:VTT domain-containing protein [Longimicrobiales bacterium]
MNDTRKRLIIAAAVLVVVFVAGMLVFRQIPETVSAPLFVLVVIVEVIVAPIPGGAIGYLGAARFGFWHAWPLLYIGNVIGTFVVFTLSRKYGAPLFEANVAPRTRDWYNNLIDRHPLLLWFIYIVPVLPLDVLSVLAGLSRLSARRFFTIAFTGFLIYTAIVAYIGSSLAHLIGITEALSVIGMIFVVVLIFWLWNTQKNRRLDANSAKPQ